MRFKARVFRAQFGHLHLFIKSLAELGAKCALLYLAKDNIRAIVKTDDDALLLWGSLRCDLTFAVFNIESKADNVIGLEVSIANLIHSLKGLTMSESIQFRLAKRGEAAYLNIEAQSIDSGAVVSQDVPVRVLSTGEVTKYGEPSVPPPLVRMVLPNPRAMCAVVDRMRATGSATKHLTLHADQRHREITLSIATSDVSIRTYFRGVLRDGEQAAGVAQPTQGSQDSGSVTVSVPIRDYGRIVRAVNNMAMLPQQADTHALLFIVPGSALVVHAPINGTTSAGDGSNNGVVEPVGALTFILNTSESAEDTLGA